MARTIKELKALGIGALASEVARLEGEVKAKIREFESADRDRKRLKIDCDASNNTLAETQKNFLEAIDRGIKDALSRHVCSTVPTDTTELDNLRKELAYLKTSSATKSDTATENLRKMTEEHDKLQQELEQVKKERDARSNITPADLLNLQNELATKATFVDPTDYVLKTNHLLTQGHLNNAQNQINNLTTQLATEQTNHATTKRQLTTTQAVLNAKSNWIDPNNQVEVITAGLAAGLKPANFVDPSDLDQIKTTLTQELGIDFHSDDWHDNLMNKLGGKKLSDLTGSDSLATLLRAKGKLSSAQSNVLRLSLEMNKFTANLNDYKDNAGEVDENKVKAYQTAKDILEAIKADPVMKDMITTDAAGKEIIDTIKLDSFKTAINSIGGSAVIDVVTYKNKLRVLFNNSNSNVNADDDWQNHLKSLNDYNALNSQLQQALQNIPIKERSILTAINDLGLEINSNELNLDKVLEKISELLNKPKKVLEEIKNNEIKTLPTLLPKSSKQTITTQISSAQTHQQLANIRNDLIKNNLDKSNNQLLRERTIFSILLVLSLLTIGILFMRTNKLSKKQKNSKLD